MAKALSWINRNREALRGVYVLLVWSTMMFAVGFYVAKWMAVCP